MGSAGARRAGAEAHCRTASRYARARCDFPSAIGLASSRSSSNSRPLALTFQPSADGKTYTSDFAVIVRFLDKDNQVARKVSQHYEVNGPLATMDSAKQGDVIFYREPELPAGVYTMETVVYDLPSAKSSVRLSTVEVTRDDPAKLRMSSLVLVKRAEKIPEKDRRPDNPLLGQGRRRLAESRRAGEQGDEGSRILLRRVPRARASRRRNR